MQLKNVNMLLRNSYGEISHERKKCIYFHFIFGNHLIVAINMYNKCLQLVAINKCKLYIFFTNKMFQKEYDTEFVIEMLFSSKIIYR